MATAAAERLYRVIGLSAAVFGIVQGLIWTILAILAILAHHGVILFEDSQLIHYNRSLMNRVFMLYLKNEHSDCLDCLITSSEFYIISWLYCILSFFWFIWSSWQFWVLIHEKWKYSSTSFLVWSVLTLILSALDVVVFGLLAKDYAYFISYFAKWPGTDEISLATRLNLSFTITASWAVMSFIIRGYVVWLLNIVLAIALINFAINLIKNGTPVKKNDSRPIDAYAPSRFLGSPWLTETSEENGQVDPWTTNPRDGNFTNNAFELDSEKSSFTQSRSFVHTQADLYENGINNNNNNNAYNNISSPRSDNNKVATIGSKNKNKPGPLNSIPPRLFPDIPDPDYSPPASPTAFKRPALKSVLKNRSQYA